MLAPAGDPVSFGPLGMHFEVAGDVNPAGHVKQESVETSPAPLPPPAEEPLEEPPCEEDGLSDDAGSSTSPFREHFSSASEHVASGPHPSSTPEVLDELMSSTPVAQSSAPEVLHDVRSSAPAAAQPRPLGSYSINIAQSSTEEYRPPFTPGIPMSQQSGPHLGPHLSDLSSGAAEVLDDMRALDHQPEDSDRTPEFGGPRESLAQILRGPPSPATPASAFSGFSELCPHCDQIACPMCGWHIAVPGGEDNFPGRTRMTEDLEDYLPDSTGLPPIPVDGLVKRASPDLQGEKECVGYQDCILPVWWKCHGYIKEYDMVVCSRTEDMPIGPPNLDLPGAIWSEWEQGPHPEQFVKALVLQEHFDLAVHRRLPKGLPPGPKPGQPFVVHSPSKKWPVGTFKRTRITIKTSMEEALLKNLKRTRIAAEMSMREELAKRLRREDKLVGVLKQ